MSEIKEWMLGIGGSEVNNVVMYRFSGTTEQAKKLLFEIIQEDVENDKENYIEGTESIDEIGEDKDGALSGYNSFESCDSEYHIDYRMVPINTIKYIEVVRAMSKR